MKIGRTLGGLVSLGMAAALSVPAVLARSQAAPAQQGETGMRDKLQSAVESLNLTDDQKSRVKDIFADAKAKRQTVWSDSSLTDDQKKGKVKELHAGPMAKLNGVLTPGQQPHEDQDGSGQGGETNGTAVSEATL